jgi:DNA (cytosine-5)-methyltransferase 1
MQLIGLCAGIGGLELGLSLVQEIEPLAFVESNKYCQATLRSRWPGVPIYNEVQTYHPPPCDIVSAGFPCQPFSSAGKRKGLSDDRWIWEHIERIICMSGCDQVFLENVPPLINAGGLSIILQSLAKLGFDAAWGLLSCSGLGAPHVRRRLFILANRCGSRCQKPIGSEGKRFAFAEGHTGTLAYSNPTKSKPGLEPSEKPKPTRPYRQTFWPPGPTADWTGLEPWPSEPGVPGVADGASTRMERLRYCARVRALGNSVSPPVAAVAYIRLFDRLRDAHEARH